MIRKGIIWSSRAVAWLAWALAALMLADLVSGQSLKTGAVGTLLAVVVVGGFGLLARAVSRFAAQTGNE